LLSRAERAFLNAFEGKNSGVRSQESE
jgi:hypothetical protein